MAAGRGHGCSVTGREALRNQQIARRFVGKRLFDACPGSRPPPAPGLTPPHAANGSATHPATLRSHHALRTRPAATDRCARMPRPAWTTSPVSSPEMPLHAPYHWVRERAGMQQDGGRCGGRTLTQQIARRLVGKRLFDACPGLGLRFVALCRKTAIRCLFWFMLANRASLCRRTAIRCLSQSERCLRSRFACAAQKGAAHTAADAVIEA